MADICWVPLGVAVGVGVRVAVGVAVGVSVGVAGGVFVGVGVLVGVAVGAFVGVAVGGSGGFTLIEGVSDDPEEDGPDGIVIEGESGVAMSWGAIPGDGAFTAMGVETGVEPGAPALAVAPTPTVAMSSVAATKRTTPPPLRVRARLRTKSRLLVSLILYVLAPKTKPPQRLAFESVSPLAPRSTGDQLHATVHRPSNSPLDRIYSGSLSVFLCFWGSVADQIKPRLP